MKTKISEGSPLDVTSPSGGTTSGVGVKIGSLIGIAALTTAAGDQTVIHTAGVFDHTSDTGAAWAVGDLLYWDDTNKVFTKTSSGNTKAGYAVATKASGATTGRIRLTPSI